jgi:hypothetical protein
MGEPVTEPAQEEQVPQEVVDPGQLEGTNPEPEVKKHEPPNGSERFNEIYYNWKEGERTIEKLTQENEELKKQKASVPPQKPQPEPEPEAPPQPTKVDVELASLKEIRKQAIKDMDTDKQIEIQEKIDGLLEQKFSQKPPAIDIDAAVKKAQIEEANSEFVRKNKWFASHNPDGTVNLDHDEDRSSYAMGLEGTLSAKWTGSYREMLEEISNRVEEKFGTKTPPKAKLSAVSSVTSPTKNTKKVIELTAAQRRAAHGFFDGHEDPEGEYKKLILKHQGAN